MYSFQRYELVLLWFVSPRIVLLRIYATFHHPLTAVKLNGGHLPSHQASFGSIRAAACKNGGHLGPNQSSASKMAGIFGPSSQIHPKWRPFSVNPICEKQNGGHFQSIQSDSSKMAATRLAVRQVFHQSNRWEAKWSGFSGQFHGLWPKLPAGIIYMGQNLPLRGRSLRIIRHSSLLIRHSPPSFRQAIAVLVYPGGKLIVYFHIRRYAGAQTVHIAVEHTKGGGY
jgi:hypothetical protein